MSAERKVSRQPAKKKRYIEEGYDLDRLF